MEKKVVELPGGQQAVASKDISHIGGWDILDNNQVFLVIFMLMVGQLCDDFYYEFHFHGIVCMALLKRYEILAIWQ